MRIQFYGTAGTFAGTEKGVVMDYDDQFLDELDTRYDDSVFDSFEGEFPYDTLDPDYER